MAQCIILIEGLEVIRTDFIALYYIVPNRNLQGLPKHLNGHPKVSEQNLLPQKRFGALEKLLDHHEPTKTSQHELDPTKPHTTGGREGDSHPPDPTPQATRPHTTGGRRKGDSHTQHPTPQGEKGFPVNPTTTHTTEGRGLPDHLGGGWGGPRSA